VADDDLLRPESNPSEVDVERDHAEAQDDEREPELEGEENLGLTPPG
jgi:hypothetical protein